MSNKNGRRLAKMSEEVSQNSEVSLYGFEFREVDNRRNPDRKSYDIKQLWQRSHEILGMALTGMKGTEIAQILNISEATVSNTLNSSLGRQKLSSMRQDKDQEYKKINERVLELTHKALNVYEEIFNSPSPDLELKKSTADTIALDIAGMRAPVKTETKSRHAHATLDEIEDFKRRGIEAARESGLLTVIEGEGKYLEEKQDN
jgi:predicted transcriptional regulator